jgi:hypothetical protein
MRGFFFAVKHNVRRRIVGGVSGGPKSTGESPAAAGAALKSSNEKN